LSTRVDLAGYIALSEGMSVAPELVEILVCPESKKPMYYFEQEGSFFCPDSRLKYRIDDGIPIMLVEEAERLSEDDSAKLLAEAKKRNLPRTGEGSPSSAPTG
jgi:uncharacterized protein YbaR (Trm112 family)